MKGLNGSFVFINTTLYYETHLSRVNRKLDSMYSEGYNRRVESMRDQRRSESGEYIPDAGKFRHEYKFTAVSLRYVSRALAGRSPRKVSNSRSAGMPRISTCLEDPEFAHARRFRSRGRARSTPRPLADGSNWNISDLTAFTDNISLIAKVCAKFHDRARMPVREFYKLSA